MCHHSDFDHLGTELIGDLDDLIALTERFKAKRLRNYDGIEGSREDIALKMLRGIRDDEIQQAAVRRERERFATERGGRLLQFPEPAELTMGDIRERFCGPDLPEAS